MRGSSSQGSLQMKSIDSNNLTKGQTATIRESIDLRLSEVFKDDSQVIMEVQDGEGGLHRPRQESSPIMLHEEEEKKAQ